MPWTVVTCPPCSMMQPFIDDLRYAPGGVVPGPPPAEPRREVEYGYRHVDRVRPADDDDRDSGGTGAGDHAADNLPVERRCIDVPLPRDHEAGRSDRRIETDVVGDRVETRDEVCAE